MANFITFIAGHCVFDSVLVYLEWLKTYCVKGHKKQSPAFFFQYFFLKLKYNWNSSVYISEFKLRI